MAYEKGARRFRPVGSRKKKTAPKYGPTGTGCPVVEEAVARLYRDQSEAHFWDLMNALNLNFYISIPWEHGIYSDLYYIIINWNVCLVPNI